MAVLGKRKASESSAPEVDANELLRRHFEARFQPLEEKASSTRPEEADLEDDDRNSEWDGLSNDDDGEEHDNDDEDINGSEEDSDSDGTCLALHPPSYRY